MSVRRRLAAIAVFLACASPAPASETITYSYDALGRVVKVSHAGSVNNGVNACYGYDPAANRSNVNVVTSGTCSNPAGSVTFSISSNGPVVEGTSSTFTVSKVGTAAGTLTVNYATANGTAIAPGDYSAGSGTLTFQIGDTAKTVAVATVDDVIVESPETFTMALSAPSGGSTINVGSATATINDNDSACSGVSFAVSDASAIEGNLLTFIVSRTGSAPGNCSVNYATADGSAAAPGDYSSASGTLTFTPGQTLQSVGLSTFSNGNSPEPNRTMYLNLSAAPTSSATISDNQGIGTIADDGVINCDVHFCDPGPL